jgi:hemoglobin-like flavoprotein
MGCSSSIPKPNTECKGFVEIKEELQENFGTQTGLTEAEKIIVKSTWKYMTTDIANNGLQIFLRIFDVCPEAKELFKVENVRHSELARNPLLKVHGARFMNGIAAAIDSLNETNGYQDELGNILFVLGQRHKNSSGFRPEYFEVFYKALMWRWEFCMGEYFTAEVSKTWSHVFLYMMEKLKEGYLSPET